MRGSNQIAPGEIVALVGSGLGPQAAVPFQLNQDGRVPRELAGTHVRFNGEPAPILYSQNGQVIRSRRSQWYQGRRQQWKWNTTVANERYRHSGSFRPQIFTLDGSGSGQAAQY
jgi:uncharacterized protein (TIGR03437 family)